MVAKTMGKENNPARLRVRPIPIMQFAIIGLVIPGALEHTPSFLTTLDDVQYTGLSDVLGHRCPRASA
jgi:hypothetical protein